MTDILYIFSVTEPVAVTHTNLTRQTETAPVLPPLADWIGVDRIDTDKVELFPIDTLGGMALSDYVTNAFAPDPDLSGAVRARLDALGGSVLLVPDTALDGVPVTGPQATLVASLPLTRPNHDARLPKADITPTPQPAPAQPDRETTPPIALIALIGMALLAGIIVLFGWN